MSNDEDEIGYTEIEKQFVAVVDDYLEVINAKLAEAAKLVSEAEQLSEEHGIPFYGQVSPLGLSYIPISFREKFASVDSDLVYDLTEAYGDYYGWKHSSIC